MLVFSYNQSKPKAVGPLLPFLASVGVGMVAEQLVTMGFKAVSKKALKAKADDFAAQATAKGGFNWHDANPYRNKDGSITISPSAHDRAKLAGLIAGTGAGLFANSQVDESGNIVGGCPPVLDQQISNHAIHEGSLKFAGRADFKKHIKEARLLITTQSKVTTNNKVAYSVHSPVTGQQFDIFESDKILEFKWRFVDGNTSDYIGIWVDQTGTSIKNITVSRSNFTRYLSPLLSAEVHGADILPCDGLYYPSTLDQVYPVPFDLDVNVKLPNQIPLEQLPPIIIANVMPPSETSGEISWQEIQKYLDDNAVDIESILQPIIDEAFEEIKPDTIYEFDDLYNIYTDKDYPVKVPDWKPPITSPDPPTGEVVEVSPIDRSLLQIAKESYQYLADTVKSSVDGLTAVTAGATGVITFLGTTMGWLPNEWIVMFSAAFGLGLFAFFFRR